MKDLNLVQHLNRIMISIEISLDNVYSFSYELSISIHKFKDIASLNIA